MPTVAHLRGSSELCGPDVDRPISHLAICARYRRGQPRSASRNRWPAVAVGVPSRCIVRCRIRAYSRRHRCAAPRARRQRRPQPWGGRGRRQAPRHSPPRIGPPHPARSRCCTLPSSSSHQCPAREHRVKGARCARVAARSACADPGPAAHSQGLGAYQEDRATKTHESGLAFQVARAETWVVSNRARSAAIAQDLLSLPGDRCVVAWESCRKPVLIAVDDEVGVLHAVERDLSSHYFRPVPHPRRRIR